MPDNNQGSGANGEQARGGRNGNAPPSFMLQTGTFMPDPVLLDGVISRRTVAFLIDAFILSCLIPVFWMIGIMSFGLLIPAIVIVLPLIPLAYHTLFIASERSATLGQRVMGLRVISADGLRPTLLQAIILTALFYLTLSATGGLLLLWCLFDDRKRCLHDILSATLMIRNDGLMMKLADGNDRSI